MCIFNKSLCHKKNVGTIIVGSNQDCAGVQRLINVQESIAAYKGKKEMTLQPTKLSNSRIHLRNPPGFLQNLREMKWQSKLEYQYRSSTGEVLYKRNNKITGLESHLKRNNKPGRGH